MELGVRADAVTVVGFEVPVLGPQAPQVLGKNFLLEGCHALLGSGEPHLEDGHGIMVTY